MPTVLPYDQQNRMFPVPQSKQDQKKKKNGSPRARLLTCQQAMPSVRRFSWAKTPVLNLKIQLLFLPKLTSAQEERPCLEALPPSAAYGLFTDYLQMSNLHTTSHLVLSKSSKLSVFFLYYHYIDKETELRRDELIWPRSFTPFNPNSLSNNCCASRQLLQPRMVGYFFPNADVGFVCLGLFYSWYFSLPHDNSLFLQQPGRSPSQEMALHENIFLL